MVPGFGFLRSTDDETARHRTSTRVAPRTADEIPMERAPSMSSDRGRSRSRTGFPRLLPPLPGSIETSLEIKRQAVHGDLGAKFFDTVVEATGVEKIENKFCKQLWVSLKDRVGKDCED